MDQHSFSTEEWHGRIAVVRVAAAVDMLTSPLLQDAIQAAHAKAPAGLIVDLSDVEFLSSAGMQVLVTAYEQITPDARFAVVADGPGTSRPMKIMGLTDFIELFASLDTALDTLTE
jgi:anti-anti-sigma factor